MTNTPPPTAGPEDSDTKAEAPPAEPTRQAPSDQGPRVSTHDMLDFGRLRRSVDNRHIAGVAGGLGRHFDVDPVIVRVALVVLTFFGGSGLLIYIGWWLLVPEEGGQSRPMGLDDRSRNIALIGIGVLAMIAAVGDWAGAFWFPWPVLIIALFVVWLTSRGRGADAPPVNWREMAGMSPAPPTGTETGASETGWQTSPASEATATTSSAPYQPLPSSGYGAPGWPVTPPAPQRPSNPRKRGPILFLATLALIAIGFGTLGVIDVAGTDVPGAAYPALAMTIIGAMLVLGAFWGRAGGLILLGFVAMGATFIATAAQDWDAEVITYQPTSASQVPETYNLNAGEYVIDLSQISDVDGLDGRQLDIDAGIGSVEVILPEDMDVSVTTDVGVGGAEFFDGSSTGGLGSTGQAFRDGGDEVPDMSIEIDLGVGQIIVREQ